MEDEFMPGENELAVTFRYETAEVELWECGGEMDSKGEIEVIRYHAGMPDLEVLCLSRRDDGTWRLGDEPDSVVEFVSVGSTEPFVYAAARAMARQAYLSAPEPGHSAWCSAFRAAMTTFGHHAGMRSMDSTLENYMIAQGASVMAAKLASEFYAAQKEAKS